MVDVDDLAGYLRGETTAAHRSLEDRLDLLRQPLDRQRFRHVLVRFHGFHLAWESGLAANRSVQAFAADRSRKVQLRHDLTALGMTASEIMALPICPEAAVLAAEPAAALGSLYVLEGSTLGGQVISRALAQAAWLPPGGLTYFNPYGPRTGPMWRAFKDWLDAQPAGCDRAAVAAGANRTFTVLETWLAG